jgi:hypothetical protein
MRRSLASETPSFQSLSMLEYIFGPLKVCLGQNRRFTFAK